MDIRDAIDILFGFSGILVVYWVFDLKNRLSKIERKFEIIQLWDIIRKELQGSLDREKEEEKGEN
jgi:hypothetical protein